MSWDPCWDMGCFVCFAPQYSGVYTFVYDQVKYTRKKDISVDQPRTFSFVYISSGTYGDFLWFDSAILEKLEESGLCMHSFVLVRHGAIACEGYWAPYTTDSLQRMYSVTKSFVGVAIGLLAQDGYVRLDDPVITYFPDKVIKQPHPYTEQMTIRDLLRMSTVHTRTADTDCAASRSFKGFL